MAEPSSDVNRRTSVLFCKSKSVSPPKSAKNTETQPTSPQLGTKTFLSVVLPRLETLLQPRKRSRSTCGDSEVEEGSPGKRLDTGKCHGAPRRHLLSPRVSRSGWALVRSRPSRGLFIPRREARRRSVLQGGAVTGWPGAGAARRGRVARPVHPGNLMARARRRLAYGARPEGRARGVPVARARGCEGPARGLQAPLWAVAQSTW